MYLRDGLAASFSDVVLGQSGTAEVFAMSSVSPRQDATDAVGPNQVV